MVSIKKDTLYQILQESILRSCMMVMFMISQSIYNFKIKKMKKLSTFQAIIVFLLFIFIYNTSSAGIADSTVENKNKNRFILSVAMLSWSKAVFETSNNANDKIQFNSNRQIAFGFDVGYQFNFKNWFMQPTLFLNQERYQFQMQFNAQDFTPYFNNLPATSNKSLSYEHVFSNLLVGYGIKMGYRWNLSEKTQLYAMSGIQAFNTIEGDFQKFFYLPGFENNNSQQGNIAALFNQGGSPPSRFGFPYMVPFSLGYSVLSQKKVYSIQFDYNFRLKPASTNYGGIIFLPLTPNALGRRVDLPLNSAGIRFQIGF
jgi:hypothetical protein